MSRYENNDGFNNYSDTKDLMGIITNTINKMPPYKKLSKELNIYFYDDKLDKHTATYFDIEKNQYFNKTYRELSDNFHKTKINLLMKINNSTYYVNVYLMKMIPLLPKNINTNDWMQDCIIDLYIKQKNEFVFFLKECVDIFIDKIDLLWEKLFDKMIDQQIEQYIKKKSLWQKIQKTIQLKKNIIVNDYDLHDLILIE